jgi:YesN/AraC family two-component response regulator
MLRETSCSVEEIMFNVGYTDISYFYRVFKKKYGMTPNQYRCQGKIIRLH